MKLPWSGVWKWDKEKVSRKKPRGKKAKQRLNPKRGYWKAVIRIPRKLTLSKSKGHGMVIQNHITGSFRYLPPEGACESEIEESLKDLEEEWGERPELITRP